MVIHTPQLLYKSIVGVQANFRANYPIHVITRKKYIDILQKKSNWGPTMISVITCYKQVHVWFRKFCIVG